MIESVVLFGEDDIGLDRVVVGLVAGTHIFHGGLLKAFPVGADSRGSRTGGGERREVFSLGSNFIPPASVRMKTESLRGETVWKAMKIVMAITLIAMLAMTDEGNDVDDG